MEIYIFYEIFFSVFLSLLALYLNAIFRAPFRFMPTTIVNAQRVSCFALIWVHCDEKLYTFL